MDLPEEILNLALIHSLDDFDEAYLREYVQTRSSSQIQSFIAEIRRSDLDLNSLILNASTKGKDILFDLLANAVNLLENDDLLEECLLASFELPEGLKVLRVIFDYYYPTPKKEYLSASVLGGNLNTVKYLYDKLGFHRPPLMNVDLGLNDLKSELTIVLGSIKSAAYGSEEDDIKGEHYDISEYLFDTGVYEEYLQFQDRFPDHEGLVSVLLRDSPDDVYFDRTLFRQIAKHLKGNRETTFRDLYTQWPYSCDFFLKEVPIIGNEISSFNEQDYQYFKNIVKRLLREGYDIKLDPTFSKERFKDFFEFFDKETSIHRKINRKL